MNGGAQVGIQGILELPQDERGPAELAKLASYFGGVKFFQTLDPNIVLQLCRFIRLEQHPANRTVFREGDVSDRCYVILSGSVGVYITADVEVDSGRRVGTSVMQRASVVLRRRGSQAAPMPTAALVAAAQAALASGSASPPRRASGPSAEDVQQAEQARERRMQTRLQDLLGLSPEEQRNAVVGQTNRSSTLALAWRSSLSATGPNQAVAEVASPPLPLREEPVAKEGFSITKFKAIGATLALLSRVRARAAVQDEPKQPPTAVAPSPPADDSSESSSESDAPPPNDEAASKRESFVSAAVEAAASAYVARFRSRYHGKGGAQRVGPDDSGSQASGSSGSPDSQETDDSRGASKGAVSREAGADSRVASTGAFSQADLKEAAALDVEAAVADGAKVTAHPAPEPPPSTTESAAPIAPSGGAAGLVQIQLQETSSEEDEDSSFGSDAGGAKPGPQSPGGAASLVGSPPGPSTVGSPSPSRVNTAKSIVRSSVKALSAFKEGVGVTMSEVAHLRKGTAFGEIALQSGALRSATIRTKEDCVFAVITRLDYLNILGKIAMDQHKERIAFLSKVPLLSGLGVKALSQLASMMQQREVLKGELVYGPETPALQAYIVREGEFGVYCRTEDALAPKGTWDEEFEGSPPSPSGPPKPRRPGRWARQGRGEGVLASLLAPQRLFGLTPYLQGERRHRESVICHSVTGRIYCLLARELVNHLPRDSRQKLMVGASLQRQFVTKRICVMKELRAAAPGAATSQAEVPALRGSVIAARGGRSWHFEDKRETLASKLAKSRKEAGTVSIYSLDGRMQAIQSALKALQSHQDLHEDHVDVSPAAAGETEGATLRSCWSVEVLPTLAQLEAAERAARQPKPSTGLLHDPTTLFKAMTGKGGYALSSLIERPEGQERREALAGGLHLGPMHARGAGNPLSIAARAHLLSESASASSLASAARPSGAGFQWQVGSATAHWQKSGHASSTDFGDMIIEDGEEGDDEDVREDDEAREPVEWDESEEEQEEDSFDEVAELSELSPKAVGRNKAFSTVALVVTEPASGAGAARIGSKDRGSIMERTQSFSLGHGGLPGSPSPAVLHTLPPAAAAAFRNAHWSPFPANGARSGRGAAHVETSPATSASRAAAHGPEDPEAAEEVAAAAPRAAPAPPASTAPVPASKAPAADAEPPLAATAWAAAEGVAAELPPLRRVPTAASRERLSPGPDAAPTDALKAIARSGIADLFSPRLLVSVVSTEPGAGEEAADTRLPPISLGRSSAAPVVSARHVYALQAPRSCAAVAPKPFSARRTGPLRTARMLHLPQLV